MKIKDLNSVILTQDAADYLSNKGYNLCVGEKYKIYLVGMSNDHIGITDKQNNEYPTFPARLLGLNIEEIRKTLSKEIEEAKKEEIGKAVEEKRMRIYISGPISGHDPFECKAKFQKVEGDLISKGYEVFNPLKNGLPFNASTSQHMRRDLNELTREDKPYDAIYMMKKWNHSAGCWTEFKVACAIGLEILTEQDDVVYRFV